MCHDPTFGLVEYKPDQLKSVLWKRGIWRLTRLLTMASTATPPRFTV